MFDTQLARHGFSEYKNDDNRFFPVSIGQIYDANGRIIPGHKRVQRDDTGDTLAVHSDKYRLIDYRTAFDAFDNALMTSGLDVTGLRIATDMADNGAKVWRQYVLPAYTEEIQPGDHVALRLVMFNSYDGSCSFRGLAGAWRTLCANGMLLGKLIVDVKVRHSGEKPIEPVIEHIVGMASQHHENIARMKRWIRVRLISAQVKALMEALPQSTKPLVDDFTARFSINEDRSLWGFHNMLTSWATHEESRRSSMANRAKVANDRSQRILTLTQGKEWQRIEEAA